RRWIFIPTLTSLHRSPSLAERRKNALAFAKGLRCSEVSPEEGRMADRKLNMALIGCGGMAGAHLSAYLRIKETEPELFDLAACCDPVRELAEKFAEQAAAVHGSKPRVYTETAE